jgi:hypothetical protein
VECLGFGGLGFKLKESLGFLRFSRVLGFQGLCSVYHVDNLGMLFAVYYYYHSDSYLQINDIVGGYDDYGCGCKR